jgi:hypothetical protein
MSTACLNLKRSKIEEHRRKITIYQNSNLERSQRELVFTFRASNSVTLHKRRAARTSKSSAIADVKRKPAFRTPNKPFCFRQSCHFHAYPKRKIHTIKRFLDLPQRSEMLVRLWKILTSIERIIIPLKKMKPSYRQSQLGNKCLRQTL